MAFGFQFVTGSGGSLVDSISSDNPPGLLIDSFFFTRSSGSTTRTYSSFNGTTLLAWITSSSINLTTDVSVSVNQSTKTVTVSAGSATWSGARGNAIVTVVGV